MRIFIKIFKGGLLKDKISIITPTYNEAKNIKELAVLISKSMKGLDYELIVVDDNSPDGTAEIAENLPKDLNVRVLHRAGKLGLSSAVMDGVKLSRGDVICVIDSDLSHPPQLIPKLYATLRSDDMDMVIASRLVKGGGTENWPKMRRLTSRIATLLASGLTKVKDPMSGFFIFRRSLIKGVHIRAIGYKIMLEILVRSRTERYCEIPFMFKDRTAGSSKLTMKTNMEYVLQLFHLYLFRIKKKVLG